MIATTEGFALPDRARPALATVDELLRDRPAVYRRLEVGDELGELSRTAIITILVGAAAFGASVGAFRGGLQILFAALKIPAVLLLTAAVCAPCLTALCAAVGRSACLRRDLALVLSSLAMTSLVAAASAPIVLLGVTLEIEYHSMALLFAACCAVGGAAGLGFFWRGLAGDRGPGRVAAAASFLCVFALVGAQMAWTVRPYLVRPRTPEVVFLRTPAQMKEESLIEAVFVTLRSARGEFTRDAAPLPGGTR